MLVEWRTITIPFFCTNNEDFSAGLAFLDAINRHQTENYYVFLSFRESFSLATATKCNLHASMHHHHARVLVVVLVTTSTSCSAFDTVVLLVLVVLVLATVVVLLVVVLSTPSSSLLVRAGGGGALAV